VCFNIDLDMGVNHNMQAFEAFAYEEKEESDEGDDEGSAEQLENPGDSVVRGMV